MNNIVFLNYLLRTKQCSPLQLIIDFTDFSTPYFLSNQLNIMVPYVDIISLCHNVAFMRNLCDAA